MAIQSGLWTLQNLYLHTVATIIPHTGTDTSRSQAYTEPQTPTEPQERTGLGTYRVTDSHRTTSIRRTLGTHRARVPSPAALVVSDIPTQEDAAATYV